MHWSSFVRDGGAKLSHHPRTAHGSLKLIGDVTKTIQTRFINLLSYVLNKCILHERRMKNARETECLYSSNTCKVICHFNSYWIIEQKSSHVNNEISQTDLTKEFYFQRIHRSLNGNLSPFAKAQHPDMWSVSYINSCHLLFIVSKYHIF